MRRSLVGLIALVSSVAAPAVAQIDPMCEKRLPVAVVGKAAKLSIHLIPPDPHKGAGGDCNYAEGDKMVLMLRLTEGGARDVKSYRGVTGEKNAKDISGLGDEAFSSGDSIVVARKGKVVIALSSFGPLSIAQLIPLAKQALAAK
jgi:hypothetical protein